MGGINVGDEYTGMKPDVDFWRDTHMRLTGETADDVKAVFEAHWKMASPDMLHLTRKAKFLPESAQLSDDKAIHPFPSGKTERGYGWEWGSELGTMEGTHMGKASPSKDSHNVYIQIFEGNPGLPTPVISGNAFHLPDAGDPNHRRDQPLFYTRCGYHYGHQNSRGAWRSSEITGTAPSDS